VTSRARTVVGMTAFHHMASLMAGANSDHDGFWWLPFGLLWILVLGTAIWLVARTVRRREPSGLERARDILAERYARGELSGEEYRERLSELGSQR
jgi:putative membrane protein